MSIEVQIEVKDSDCKRLVKVKCGLTANGEILLLISLLLIDFLGTTEFTF